MRIIEIWRRRSFLAQLLYIFFGMGCFKQEEALKYARTSIDMGAVPYGGHLTRNGDRYYTTKYSFWFSLLLRVVLISYISFAAYGFLAEVKIAIKSESIFRDHSHTMSSDIVTKVEVEAMRGFQDNASLKHLFFIAIGAEIYQVDDTGEHIRLTSNCSSASFDNIPEDNEMMITIRETLLPTIHTNVWAPGESDLCQWSDSRVHTGSMTILALFIIDPFCSTYGGSSERNYLRLKTYIPNNNNKGYSMSSSTHIFVLKLGSMHTLEFPVSTLRTHKHSKWWPFAGKNTVDYYTLGGKDTKESIWDIGCAASLYLNLDSVISEQNVWPETLAGMAATVGGFLAIVAAIATALQIYNSYQLERHGYITDMDALEQMKIDQEEIKKVTTLRERTTNDVLIKLLVICEREILFLQKTSASMSMVVQSL